MNTEIFMLSKESTDGVYKAWWSTIKRNTFLLQKTTSGETTYYEGSGASAALAKTQLISDWADRANLTFVEFVDIN